MGYALEQGKPGWNSHFGPALPHRSLPWDGVMPPSPRVPHSSTLSAPPASAARALSRLSTQTSMFMATHVGGGHRALHAFGFSIISFPSCSPNQASFGASFLGMSAAWPAGQGACEAQSESNAAHPCHPTIIFQGKRHAHCTSARTAPICTELIIMFK